MLDKGLSVSRLIVQTSRQSGVAFVYQDLLDFDGDEIYMRADARLEGRTYGEALFAYEDCSVIGVRARRRRDHCSTRRWTRHRRGRPADRDRRGRLGA